MPFPRLLAPLFACLLHVVAFAQPTARPTLTVNRDASVTVTLPGVPTRSYRLEPRFVVMARTDNPKLGYQDGRKFDNQLGTLKLVGWTKPSSTSLTIDYFAAAIPVVLTATSARQDGNVIRWTFPTNGPVRLTASLTLPANAPEPVIDYQFTASRSGYYSVGFAGMPELDPQQADAIWQPWVWQEKRFPTQSFLSVEEMCGLPATMVEKDGVTYGVVADPDQIPFRLPSMQYDQVAFGVLLRNQAGRAQPQFWAPVLGSGQSKLEAGQAYTGRCRLLFYRGSQPDAFRYVAQTVFGFRDYRRNVSNNLNQTLENFIDFGMNDAYVGWNPDLRGFDYSTDVAQTVKVVSGLHPLSVALLTDDRSIYQRRALPMIEFGLSRQKYLFALQRGITRQDASGKMAGPGIEVAELASLEQFFGGRSPVFRRLADSLKNTTRELNLRIPSRGDSWPNLLGLYRMNHDSALLQTVRQRADAYIQNRIQTPQTDFRDANVPGSGQFWSDFAPAWPELLDLYEETRDKRYLDAALAGANRYVQYAWFSPRIPDSTITVNRGGRVDHRSFEGIRDKMPIMSAAEQTVPAWRVSQIGLTPEACNTFPSNPAIFLSHYAAPLLRLAHYTNNEFLRAVARSAVVGRYTNYPGYDINGIFTTVYERPDYPLRAYNEISYNQVYYNHVWPHIALLFDYLVSDTFVKSAGAIRFPHQFVPGYAYLKSNVYGHAPGEFYGEKNVRLWLPKQALRLDNEQVNYLTGYGNGKFYVALTNQSPQPIDVTLTLNPNVVPLSAGRTYTVQTWQQNQPSQTTTLANGQLRLRVAANGITAVAIDGLTIRTQLQEAVYESGLADAPAPASYQRVALPVGTLSAMTLAFGRGLTSAYFWLEANADQFRQVTLHYRPAGQTDWKTLQDSGYPFEFSLPLPDSVSRLEWRIEGTRTADGTVVDTGVHQLIPFTAAAQPTSRN